MGNVLNDLIIAVEDFIESCEADCDVLPNHDTDCMCEPHRDVRRKVVEIKKLIQAIKRS